MESGCVLTDGTALHVFPSRSSIEDILHTKVNATDRGDQEDPFYIVNLGRLAHLYNQVRVAIKLRGVDLHLF